MPRLDVAGKREVDGMVVVKIIGGLGNQLFQYAAARAVALRNRTPLKLDITGFETYDWHAYSLRPLSMNVEFATPEEIERAKNGGQRGIPRQTREASPLSELPPRTIFSEPGLRPYNPAITNLSPHVYIDGYWQSEKYFPEIADLIRREAQVKAPLTGENARIAEAIRDAGTAAVSLHVRRGNYITNPAVNRLYGTCGLDYFQAAIAHMAQHVARPHFFIFSDDPNWTKENLRLSHAATYVTHNDAAHDAEDLRLMSLCRHFIMANSSFSWWGAWLGTAPDKLVIGPKNWMNDASVDTRDIMPANWMRI